MTKGPVPVPPEIRFWRFVEKSDGCWLWTGMTNGRYGLFFPGGGRLTPHVFAHRFSYEMHKGRIPDGLVIDHLCFTPLCVRPEHLEVVTYQTNSHRGKGPAAQRARQRVCIYGHPLDGRNPTQGTRRCNTCHARRQREYMARKRAGHQPG